MQILGNHELYWMESRRNFDHLNKLQQLDHSRYKLVMLTK